MKVCVVQDNGLNESLALTELSAFLRRDGHDIALFIEKEERSLEKSLASFAPDIFLVPGDIGGHHWFHRMLSRLKRSFPIPILAGGTYPTFYPDDAFADAHLDYLVLGEAEAPTRRLLEALQGGGDPSGIPGVWGRHRGGEFNNPMGQPLKDLDDLPIPDRALYYKYGFIRDFSLKRFTSGRGCHNSCSFCFNTRLKALCGADVPYVRRKSVDRVLDEIGAVQRHHPMRSIHFSDDIFVTSKAWMREFAEKYPRRFTVAYSCNTMVDHLADDVIEMLAASGCRAIALGIESGVASIRRRVLGKRFTNEEAVAKARRLAAKGVKVFTFNMFALPGETIDDALQTVRLNIEMGAAHGRSNLAAVLPQTELEAIARGLACAEGSPIPAIMEIPDMSDARAFREYFARPEFDNLVSLFPLATAVPRAFPIIARLAKGRRRGIYGLVGLLAMAQERAFFDIDLPSGLRYLRHTGVPYGRSKNFASLI